MEVEGDNGERAEVHKLSLLACGTTKRLGLPGPHKVLHQEEGDLRPGPLGARCPDEPAPREKCLSLNRRGVKRFDPHSRGSNPKPPDVIYQGPLTVQLDRRSTWKAEGLC